MSILIVAAEKYVFTFLNEKLDTNYIYHNLTHTQRVLGKTNELIENLKINEYEGENLQVATLFHDTGFVKGTKNHEEESVKIATAFLEQNNIEDKRIAEIVDLILATKMNHIPKNDLEKIIIDADCSHIGNKNFDDYTELLRKEWELVNDKIYSESEWTDINIKFLTKEHRFYTDYALKNWSKTKGKNIVSLLKYQKKINQESKKFNQKKEALNLKKNKVVLPERGIETMFRVALRNHITLSDIADTKANILLSVNAIVVSLILSNLLPKLDNPSNEHLFVPSLIFIAFTVASIILSIIATRPNVTQGKFTKKDVANKKVNLLFFGNFHQMKLKDFEWGMTEMMQDRDYLYSSLTKDLYFLGLVLNRKYKILRVTYTVFMIGIIVSVIAFSVSFKIHGYY